MFVILKSILFNLIGKYIPTLFGKAKQNPGTSIVTILLALVLGVCVWLGVSNWYNENKIERLETKCENLKTRNNQLVLDLSEANVKIGEQNNSIDRFKNKVVELESNLDRISKENNDLQKEIDNLISKGTDAPVDAVGALKWLREKSVEIKQWQN